MQSNPTKPELRAVEPMTNGEFDQVWNETDPKHLEQLASQSPENKEHSVKTSGKGAY